MSWFGSPIELSRFEKGIGKPRMSDRQEQIIDPAV